MKLTAIQTQQLESLIDDSSLAEVLAALVEICDGKAEHLSTNWQDGPGADYWLRASRAIERTAARESIRNVSL